MEKQYPQPQWMASSEEVKEENERLTNGDSKSDKEGHPMKKFVPINEVQDKIPDSIDLEDQIDDSEMELEKISKEDKKKAKEEVERKKNELMGLYQNDKNVAHYGPDFVDKSESTHQEALDVLKDAPRIQNIIKNPTRLSFSKRLLKLFGSSYENDRPKAEGKDNLKTMSASEKERQSREEIREFLHN